MNGTETPPPAPSPKGRGAEVAPSPSERGPGGEVGGRGVRSELRNSYNIKY